MRQVSHVCEVVVGLYRTTDYQAPGVFQRCMENLFQWDKGVSVYLNDILVTGPNIESHLATLDTIFSVLATISGLRLNKAECVFMLPRMEYLGHVIDEHGLRPFRKPHNHIMWQN